MARQVFGAVKFGARNVYPAQEPCGISKYSPTYGGSFTEAKPWRTKDGKSGTEYFSCFASKMMLHAMPNGPTCKRDYELASYLASGEPIEQSAAALRNVIWDRVVAVAEGKADRVRLVNPKHKLQLLEVLKPFKRESLDEELPKMHAGFSWRDFHKACEGLMLEYSPFGADIEGTIWAPKANQSN